MFFGNNGNNFTVMCEKKTLFYLKYIHRVYNYHETKVDTHFLPTIKLNFILIISFSKIFVTLNKSC